MIYAICFSGSVAALICLIATFLEKYRPSEYKKLIRLASVCFLIPPVFFVMAKFVVFTIIAFGIVVSIFSIRGLQSEKTPKRELFTPVMLLFVAGLHCVTFMILSNPGFGGGYC